MKKESIKLWLAWFLGVASFLAILAITTIITDKLEIKTYIDFGKTIVIDHRYYEEEKDGDFTAIGIALNILAAMLATRVGMAVYHGKINGGVSTKGNIDFITCVVGVILYGLLGAIFFALSEKIDSDFLLTFLRIVNLGMIVGIFILCKNWRDKKIRDIKTSDE